MGQDIKMTEDGKIIKDVMRFSGVRKTIAKELKYEQAGEYFCGGSGFMKFDITALKEARKQFAEQGYKFSFTAFYIKLVACVLEKVPILNASFDGKKIEIYESKNIAIGVSGPGNILYAPVIRDVQTKGLVQISDELKTMIEEINTGTIPMEKMQGGTYTISSLGMRKVSFFTTTVSPGQVACLGIGLSQDEPVVEDGQIVIRPMNYFSSSVNHAVVMGADVCDFFDGLYEVITNPMDYLNL